MHFDEQQRRQALQAFLTRTGIRVSPWEREAGLGDGTLRKFMDDKSHTLTDRTYQRLAAAASKLCERPITVTELQGLQPAQASLLTDLPVAHRRPGLSEAPASFTPPPDKPDIPVWASVAAGDGDGEMILTAEPIDYIRRSERTLNVRDPWAFHVVGDSMLERLAQGDQVVINPALPLLPGSDCVFVHQGEDGVLYGLVKRLLRVAPETWRVRQFNPAKDYELSRKKWAKAYRIAEIRPRM